MTRIVELKGLTEDDVSAIYRMNRGNPSIRGNEVGNSESSLLSRLIMGVLRNSVAFSPQEFRASVDSVVPDGGIGTFRVLIQIDFG